MKSFISVAVLASAFAFGCNKSTESKVEELSEAQEAASNKADEARREADIKSAKAYDEANQKIANEREKVAEKTDDVTASIATARADLQRTMEEKLAKIDKRLVDLREKISTSKTTKAPRADLEQSLAGLKTQSASMRDTIPNVQNAGASALGAMKTDFEARVNQLEQSLDELERRV
jgi:predicted  nucleic acid-binding Zn-ribbon protein